MNNIRRLLIRYGWPADFCGLTWFFWCWNFSQTHENGTALYTGFRVCGLTLEWQRGPLSEFEKFLWSGGCRHRHALSTLILVGTVCIAYLALFLFLAYRFVTG